MYRILKTGTIKEGDKVELVKRIHPRWTIRKILLVLFGKDEDSSNIDALKEISQLPELANKFRDPYLKKIERISKKQNLSKL